MKLVGILANNRKSSLSVVLLSYLENQKWTIYLLSNFFKRIQFVVELEKKIIINFPA